MAVIHKEQINIIKHIDVKVIRLFEESTYHINFQQWYSWMYSVCCTIIYLHVSGINNSSIINMFQERCAFFQYVD